MLRRKLFSTKVFGTGANIRGIALYPLLLRRLLLHLRLRLLLPPLLLLHLLLLQHPLLPPLQPHLRQLQLRHLQLLLEFKRHASKDGWKGIGIGLD